jgi:hypothetical protein
VLILKGYILYDSTYITLSKCQNYRNGGQVNQWLPWGKEKMEQEPVEMPIKDNRGTLVVMEMVCIHVNIQFAVLYLNFTRSYYWEKLDKICKESLRVISYNCMLVIF